MFVNSLLIIFNRLLLLDLNHLTCVDLSWFELTLLALNWFGLIWLDLIGLDLIWLYAISFSLNWVDSTWLRQECGKFQTSYSPDLELMFEWRATLITIKARVVGYANHLELVIEWRATLITQFRNLEFRWAVLRQLQKHQAIRNPSEHAAWLGNPENARQTRGCSPNAASLASLRYVLAAHRVVAHEVWLWLLLGNEWKSCESIEDGINTDAAEAGDVDAWVTYFAADVVQDSGARMYKLGSWISFALELNCLTWLDLTRLGLTWLDLIWFHLIWLDLTWSDLSWPCLDWFDVTWFDLFACLVACLAACLAACSAAPTHQPTMNFEESLKSKNLWCNYKCAN